MTATLVVDAGDHAFLMREQDGRSDLTSLIAQNDAGAQYIWKASPNDSSTRV